MFRKNIIVLALMLTTSVNAFSDEYFGYVKGFSVRKGGQVLLNVTSPNAVAACGGGVWNFAFTLTDVGAKEWMSMLLVARTTNTIIKVGYQPTVGGSCDVAYLYVLD